MEFASGFHNSQSKEFWKLVQKGVLSYLKYSRTMPNLEDFGLQYHGVW
jgi:hypothetical protein